MSRNRLLEVGIATALIGVIFAVMAVSCGASQAQSGLAADQLKSQILSRVLDFSKRTKIDIDPDKLFYSSFHSGVIATVPSRGLEKIDPKQMKGRIVEVGVVLVTVDITVSDGSQELRPPRWWVLQSQSIARNGLQLRPSERPCSALGG